MKIKMKNDHFDLNQSLKTPLIEELLQTGLVPENLNESFKRKGWGDISESFEESMKLMQARAPYIKDFGFCLLNEKLLSVIALEFKKDKIIEVGAGSGWLSYNLKQKGLDITPVDAHTENNSYGFYSHTSIISMPAEKYITQNPYDTILMSWPDYESDFAACILDLMPPGKTLIYIGERYGGCTANDRFFELLEERCTINSHKTQMLQKFSQRWAGIHDDWYVYQT